MYIFTFGPSRYAIDNCRGNDLTKSARTWMEGSETEWIIQQVHGAERMLWRTVSMEVISFGSKALLVSERYCKNTKPGSEKKAAMWVTWAGQIDRRSKIPNGLSKVFDGVRTTGSDDRCFPPRRKPVLAVSTSDMMPGSSSNSGPWCWGVYALIGMPWEKSRQYHCARCSSHALFLVFHIRFSLVITRKFYVNTTNNTSKSRENGNEKKNSRTEEIISHADPKKLFVWVEKKTEVEDANKTTKPKSTK